MLYRTLLETELKEIQALMLEAVNQTPSDIRFAINKLVNGGGKQLRPSLVLLSCHVFNAPYAKTKYVAAAVEMLHTATLIHDDLIDNAFMRRGSDTLNANYSSAVTVLSGDITFAIAAKFAALSENILLVQKFALTLETICQGELNQMLTGHNTIPSISDYYNRINAKTASLFSLCTEAGSILAGCSSEQAEQARSFGQHLGMAFQIADDVLDFMGSERHLGKPVAGDLREGLITLPVLHYHEQHPHDSRIQSIIEGKIDTEEIHTLVADLRKSEAAEWAMHEANTFINKALDVLTQYPATPYRDAMEEIAKFAVQRRY